jgi:hypothetical protein
MSEEFDHQLAAERLRKWRDGTANANFKVDARYHNVMYCADAGTDVRGEVQDSGQDRTSHRVLTAR